MGRPGLQIVHITLATIAPSARRLQSDPTYPLVRDYLGRAGQYEPCDAQTFSTEAELFAAADRRGGRSPAALLLFDSQGKLLSSRDFAGRLSQLRDSGRQQLVIAIGPASGWSPAALQRADLVVSLGPMTLPHALAQVVVAEQIYRALTILAGHPYHCGH